MGLVNLVKYSLWGIPWFRHLFNALEIRNDRFDLYCEEDQLENDSLYAPTFQAFDQRAQWSKENHIPFLVVIIPDHLQVLDRNLFEGCDIDRPQRMLKTHLNKLGIQHIDLMPYFLDAKDPRRLYFREDKHWTAEGHQVAADVLFEYLNKETTYLSDTSMKFSPENS